MKDARIRYRPAERAAVIARGVRAFYLTSGNLSGTQMAELLMTSQSAVWARAEGDGAALFAVSRGGVREIALDD